MHCDYANQNNTQRSLELGRSDSSSAETAQGYYYCVMVLTCVLAKLKTFLIKAQGNGRLLEPSAQRCSQPLRAAKLDVHFSTLDL